VVATWGALDVWVTRQVWKQRHGVISTPSSTARALRRERRRARRQARQTERAQERIRRQGGAGQLSHSCKRRRGDEAAGDGEHSHRPCRACPSRFRAGRCLRAAGLVRPRLHSDLGHGSDLGRGECRYTSAQSPWPAAQSAVRVTRTRGAPSSTAVCVPSEWAKGDCAGTAPVGEHR
jgi:hypothetical protein